LISRRRSGGPATGDDRRLEGSSDAADLLLVVMSRCPNCSRRGVLTLGYGPNATEDDVAALECLDLDGG
jgi:hypothetical protein